MNLRASRISLVSHVYRRFWFYAILSATAIDLLLYALLRGKGIPVASNLTVFVAAPGFIGGLLQLGRGFSLERAAFIKDYVTKFVTDEPLYSAYHNLIYTYDNDSYAEIKAAADLAIEAAEKGTASLPKFVLNETLNKERPEGRRLYDSRLFIDTEEERRLDAVLVYFEIIAFYYVRGFIRMEDIVNIVGMYLSYINRCHAVRDYLDRFKTEWQKIPAGKTTAPLPFSSLHKLLDDIQKPEHAQKMSAPA